MPLGSGTLPACAGSRHSRRTRSGRLPERQAPGIPPRAHAAGYAAGSGALWLVWLVTRPENPGPTDLGAGYYWPVWIMLVWGIALTLHALHAGGRLPRLSPGRPSSRGAGDR